MALIEKIALIFIANFLALDTLFGAANLNGLFGVAIIIKVSIMLLLVILSLKRKDNLFFVCSTLGVTIAILLILSARFSSSLSFEISTISKILFFLIGVAFFNQLEEDKINYVRFIVIWSFLFIVLNVVLGCLGFGEYTYEAIGYGYKGFINSGNELSFLLVVLGALLLIDVRDNVLLSLLVLFSSLVLGLFIGTKSAIFSFIIMAFVYAFYQSQGKLIIVIIILMFGSCLAYVNSEMLLSSKTISEIVIKFEGGDLNKFLFSDRDVYFSMIKEHLSIGSDLPSFFFGNGRGILLQFGIDSVEMDFVDIFIWYGALFSLLIFSSIIYIMRSFFSSLNLKDALFCNTLFLLIVVIAALAGHVFTSGMITPMLGIFIFYAKRRNVNEIENIQHST